jgi:hypothetical protein
VARVAASKSGIIAHPLDDLVPRMTERPKL